MKELRPNRQSSGVLFSMEKYLGEQRCWKITLKGKTLGSNLTSGHS